MIHKPLYVSRRLINPTPLRLWAKSQGLKSIMKPEDLHVTIMYSKTVVSWEKLPPAIGNLRIANGPRAIRRLGPSAALVLRFNSPELHSRWKAFRDIGASWEHDGYRPHVTLSWEAGDIDASSLIPYTGPLLFGPEKYKEIDESWHDSRREQLLKSFYHTFL